MADKWEASAAAAVIGLAGFQLLGTYKDYAPALKDLRGANPSTDGAIRTHLKDANILVGGIAVILGATYAVLTKDKTALIVMLAIWGSTALYYQTMLQSEPVGSA